MRTLRQEVRWATLVLLLCLPYMGWGQIWVQDAKGLDRGREGYAFLHLAEAPRLAALGGKAPALVHGLQPGVAVHNPALALPELHQYLQVAYTLMYAGLNYSQASYFHELPSLGMVGASVRQLWYGRFNGYDEQGQPTGSFTAYDVALALHYNQEIAQGLHVGFSLAPIISSIERYTSFALAMDIGVLYYTPNRLFAASLLCRNLGSGLKGYTPRRRELTPLELMAGVDITLAHAPLRFLITLQNLENWHLRYNPNTSYRRLFGDGKAEDHRETVWEAILGEALAHPIIGVEITPVKYVYFQLGYNHSRRMEMQLEARPFLVGFSWGIGVEYRHFQFNFSRSLYHLHGAMNHVSVGYCFARPSMKVAPPEALDDAYKENAPDETD